MSIADSIINKAIYKDKDYLVFEDMSVINLKKNKSFGNKLNISKKEGYTNKYKGQNDQSLYNIIVEKEDLKGTIYTAPYLQIKFSEQEEAEGDHRNMYIMHNGDVLVEDFHDLSIIKQNQPEEIYGLNVKALSRMLKEEFIKTNEKKYKLKKGKNTNDI